jgi:hypothetical protein
MANVYALPLDAANALGTAIAASLFFSASTADDLEDQVNASLTATPRLVQGIDVSVSGDGNSIICRVDYNSLITNPAAGLVPRIFCYEGTSEESLVAGNLAAKQRAIADGRIVYLGCGQAGSSKGLRHVGVVAARITTFT